MELKVLDSTDNYKWVKTFCTGVKDEETGQVRKIINTIVDIEK